MRDVCLCKNTSCGLGRRLAPPFGCGDLRIVVACPTLAAIDASSGGGLPHLRFSIALFAARAGERGATRYHLYRPVGGGKWPKPKGGQRSPWPEIKAMMMLMMLMMVMRMLVMLVIYQFSGWRFAPTSRLLLGN